MDIYICVSICFFLYICIYLFQITTPLCSCRDVVSQGLRFSCTADHYFDKVNICCNCIWTNDKYFPALKLNSEAALRGSLTLISLARRLRTMTRGWQTAVALLQ